MKYRFLVFTLCLFFLASCSDGVVYKHKEKLNGMWDYDKVLSYTIPVQDTVQKYDLVAKVNHSPEFSYQNFYVELSTKFPDKKEMTDAVSFQLADGMGSWVGDCSSSCDIELLLQARFRFQQIGDYVISIKNNSRKELEGIHSIELKLIELEDIEKK